MSIWVRSQSAPVLLPGFAHLRDLTHKLLDDLYAYSVFQGQGCTKNTIKAKKYFEKAKEFGHPGASDEMLKMVNLLSQVSGVDRQR